MQSDEDEYDSSLERSLEDFDDNSEHSYEDNSQSDEQQQQSKNQSDNSDGQEINPNKNKNKEDKQDDEEKRDYYKQYLKPDEQVEADAPITVVVQGSKQSGKSSLIRSLVRHFTKHKIQTINGTITLRSNKKQRITLIQCPNDMCAMIDLAKVADIAILLIDASLGFEMETFQFLSLLKSHGFPNVMGVLTHLDFFKENKQMRKTKKKFKKRFEYEVGGNYKLFNLDKWEKGLYEKIQISKIGRYLGTGKIPQIPWRQNHPFLIIDRWQTQQDRNYKNDDNVDVSFYGYIRGSSYRLNGKIHMVGVGDYMIKSIESINDPCPQYKKPIKEQEQKPKLKGDLEDDSDNDNDIEPIPNQGQNGGGTSTPLKRKRRTLNQQERLIYAPSCNLGVMHLDHSAGYITIPKQYVKFTKMDQQQKQDNLEEGIQIMRNMQNLSHSINDKLKQRDNDFEIFDGVMMQGDKDDNNQIDENNSGKRQFQQKQKEIRTLKKQTQNISLINLHATDDFHRKDDLETVIYESKQPMKTHDCSKFHPQGQFTDNLKSLFVTGMDADVLKEMEDEDEESQQLKTNNNNNNNSKKYTKNNRNNKRQQNQIKKILNTDYTKATISEQTNMFQKGQYVCLTVSSIKYGVLNKFSNDKPMILARINLGQDNFGFLNVKFKRHRWYSNLLKSNDPIIISSGWRRYQSMIVFATNDENQRMRYLKYTPKHDFCNAVFYGNFVQQNSGITLTQTVRNDLKKFRIAGTGLVMEINKSYEIMKKIKLIGEPFKIMKNTAFVKGMFNSSMEVANYLGAQIRTVSGVRGQVKKVIKEGGEGTFRATFQDKIVISDIIFCRSWYKIILERYYNPILTYEKKRIMKTKYELRMQKGIDLEKNPDSEYKTVDRAPKVFNPFMISKKLEAKLPFKTAEKFKVSKKEQIRRLQSEKVPKILQGDKERQVASLIQRLNTIKHQKEQKQDLKFKEKNRLKAARQKPKQLYYQQVKRQQKSEKMASITRKKNQEIRKKAKSTQNAD